MIYPFFMEPFSNSPTANINDHVVFVISVNLHVCYLELALITFAFSKDGLILIT